MRNLTQSLSFYSLILIMFNVGCAPSGYRILETSKSEFTQDESDADVNISYNLWAEGGKLELSVENTSDSAIYVDWLQSSLIINSNSLTLFQPTEVSSTASYSSSSVADMYGGRQNRGFSRSVNTGNNRIEIIPPHSMLTRTFYDGQLTAAVYDCDLKLNPKKESAVSYEELVTPFTFGISLASCETLSCHSPEFTTENFFVSEVRLVTSSQFKGTLVKSKNCNGKIISNYSYPHRASDSYYFKDTTQGTSKGGAVVVVLLLVGLFGVVVASGAL